MDNLQLDYERRAQERRETLDRDNYNIYMPPPSFEDTTIDIGSERRTEIYPNEPAESLDTLENRFSHPNPAPLYISQGNVSMYKYQL